MGEVVPPAADGLEILSDYVWQADNGATNGVFVFARGRLLAGLEVWSVDGMQAAPSLPAVELLRPISTAQTVREYKQG